MARLFLILSIVLILANVAVAGILVPNLHLNGSTVMASHAAMLFELAYGGRTAAPDQSNLAVAGTIAPDLQIKGRVAATPEDSKFFELTNRERAAALVLGNITTVGNSASDLHRDRSAVMAREQVNSFNVTDRGRGAAPLRGRAAFAYVPSDLSMGDDSVMTPEEARFLDLTNRERAAKGLSRLVVDPLLVEVGREHSREMAERSYFSHTSPTSRLRTPMDRYLLAETRRPSWALVGENLFYCSIVDVDRGHSAFMNSKGHRDNILEPRYERMGVGIYVNQKGEFYVTEMFLAKTEA